MNNIRDIWIHQELNARSITLREHFKVNESFNCFVGRIGASDAKMFQIELEKSTNIHKNYLKRFHGVEIRVLDSKNGKKDITIILSDNDLLDVFILFIEDLIKSLKTINEQNNIPPILDEKVRYWGKLFAKVKGDLLSKERQRGLYGELTFLNTLLHHTNDFEKVISSWTGPEGANQDFTCGLSAVEVKSSKSTKPNVNIASELQLDWTILENLYLHIIHLDELNNGSDTLKKLIELIKQQLQEHYDLLRLFEEKLNLIGIPIGEEKHYNEIGYVIRSKLVYKVQNGFPVLINETINNLAIHNVRYQIDIAALKPFEVDIESVISKMI